MCVLLLVGSAITLRFAIEYDDWMLWRGRMGQSGVAASGLPPGSTVRMNAREGLYTDRTVIKMSRPVVVRCTCFDKLRSCTAIVAELGCGDDMTADGPCDRECGYCDVISGCEDRNATFATRYQQDIIRKNYEVRCASPTKLGTDGCRRLKAARVLLESAFAFCVGACVFLALSVQPLRHVSARWRFVAEFCAAICGNLSSSSGQSVFNSLASWRTSSDL